MRQITPRSPIPAELQSLQHRFPHPQLADWETMHQRYPSEFRAILEQLAYDQWYFCIYCEICLDPQSSNRHERGHIEHHQPKSRNPGRMFDWSNLMFCCLASNHCGMHKGQRFFSGFVNPYIDPVHDWLEVSSLTGEIRPSRTCPPQQRQNVNDSIKLLNLNEPALARNRRDILRQITRDIDVLDAFPDALAGYLQTANTSNLPFISARRALIQKLIP